MSNYNGPKKEFPPLPEGDYKLALKDREMKKTAAGNGRMLVAKFRVEEGEHAGRIVYHNFMVQHNDSAKSQEIGQTQLDRFLKAVGIEKGLEFLSGDYSLVDELKGKAFVGKLIQVPAGEYVDKKTGETKTSKASNKITTFKVV